MAFGPARPPVTEDVAEAIVKDLKSNETAGATSEVPMAFLKPAAASAVTPEQIRETRKRMMLMIGAAVAAVVLLLIIISSL